MPRCYPLGVNIMNLYRVTLRGMQDSYGISYVIAEDAGVAYAKVYNNLTSRDIGRWKDRVLDKVELLAEDSFNPGCERYLYL